MGKQSTYLKVTAEQKATMGKYTAEHGIINAIRHFTAKFPEGALKESTVRGWKKAYLAELHLRQRAGKDILVNIETSDATFRLKALHVASDRLYSQHVLHFYLMSTSDMCT